jgi:predicted ribosome quality control (RQC) complex YloA/Tae2 family protein
MEFELDFSKSVDENASLFFEKSKEARKKILGLKKYLSILEERQKQFALKESSSAQKITVEDSKKKKVSKKWFEHFRWFFSSDNFLVVGGKDAKSNEEIVKKRMKKNDAYFHAEVFGAPHCIVVAPEELKGKEFVVPDSTLLEASQFAVTFSKAWEEGRAIADAYSVKPEQVSKSAKPGEFLGTGSFMIYGERNWFKKTSLSCAIGYFPKEKKLMCAPLSAVKKHCRVFLELKQGSKSKELIAKELKEWFEKKGLLFSVDDFVSALPNGKFGF